MSAVASVDDAIAKWRQGDVAGVRVARWFADPRLPMTGESEMASAEVEGDTALVSMATDGLVVVSQTCDVVRSTDTRPFVTLAPLTHLPDDMAREARAGLRPRYAPVPLEGPDAFADLDIVFTVEKSLLARWQRRPGWAEDADARRFGQAVGRKYARFAFPDDLSIALSGLVDRVRGKHGKDSDEGRALAALEEIRVTGTPSWSASSIEIFLTFAPPTRLEAEATLTPEEWDELVDAWLGRCQPHGVVSAIEGAMIPLDELTARQYVDSDPLDLDHLSA